MVYCGKRDLLSIKRRQSLMSQVMVASKLGVAQSQYSNIENGYANPTCEQAKILIEMFDLPEDYFNGGDNDGEKQAP